MADIFDEVESDLRSERMRAELLRYGKVVAAAAVVVAIGIIVWQGMLWRDRRNEQRVASAYFAAVEAAVTPPAKASPGKTPTIGAAAEADFARLTGANTPVGYRTLARLNAAGLAIRNHDPKLALKLWHEIITDKASDPLYQGLARLLWVTHQIGTVKPGSDTTPLTKELAPLLASDSPWQPMAEEASALISLAKGDKKAATTTLTAIVGDPTVPVGLHARAAALLARLAP